MTCLVKVVHLLGAPERGPDGCDNTPVGIVRPWEAYFEARASLFVCLKDKTCPRAEGGGIATRAPAALQLVPLSRCPVLQGLGPGFPGCFVARRSRTVGLGRCCSAPLYFVRSRLGVVTEGIFCPWSAVSSRATQASAFRRVWSLVPGTAINRGRGVSLSSPAS